MDLDFSGDGLWGAQKYRWSYARGDRLRAACESAEVLAALVEQLDPPGRHSVLEKLDDKGRRRLIKEQLQHLSGTSTSPWKGRPLVEVLAAHAHRAKLPIDVKSKLFFPVAVEEDLRKPVTAWLRRQRLQVADEVFLGIKKADLLGYRKEGWLSERLVAVELKNDLKELDRGFAQLATYTTYTMKTYLACTPDFAALYLQAHLRSPNVRSWDARALDDKLRAMGCGLLLVEGGDVVEALEPVEKAPASSRRAEVWAILSTITSTGSTPHRGY